MPQRSKGARLWLEPANGRRLATWVIRDGKLKQRTGFRADQAQEAERALADYIGAKYEAPRRRERNSAQVKVADVISIYAVDVAGRHARPAETAAQLGRLLEFFGDRTLAHVSRATCNAYVAARQNQKLRGASWPTFARLSDITGPRACVRPSRP